MCCASHGSPFPFGTCTCSTFELRFSPCEQAKLDVLRIPLRPSEAELAPLLGARDTLPEGELAATGIACMRDAALAGCDSARPGGPLGGGRMLQLHMLPVPRTASCSPSGSAQACAFPALQQLPPDEPSLSVCPFLCAAGRVTHRLLLTYKLKLEEGGKVTPTLPALNRCVAATRQPLQRCGLCNYVACNYVVCLLCRSVPVGRGDKLQAAAPCAGMASNWRHAPQGCCAPASTCPCLVHAHVLLLGLLPCAATCTMASWRHRCTW